MFTPIETQNISPDASRTSRTEISYQFLKRDFFSNFNFYSSVHYLAVNSVFSKNVSHASLYKPADQSRSAVVLNLN